MFGHADRVLGGALLLSYLPSHGVGQMKLWIRLLGAGAVLVLSGACADTAPLAPEDRVAPRGPEVRDGDPLVQMVVDMGFRADMIEDRGSYFLVEGDIRISKAQLRDSGPPRTGGLHDPQLQYRTTSLVGSPKVNQIRVDLSGLAAEPGWQNAAATALGIWSQVPGSYVQIVSGSPADVTFALGCLGSNVAAEASWPSGGNPGSTVTVNRVGCIGFAQNDQQRLHNMVHEIGHTLGFRHTNWQARGELAGTVGAVHVYGTPTGNDAGSVMNGGTALNTWAGFSAADALATRTLYPLPTPTGLAVSHPSGTVVLSWNPVVGAASYLVRRVEERTVNDWISNNFQTTVTETWSGSVSGTSYNTGNAWTGTSSCMWSYTWSYDDSSTYSYLVVAEFPNGTSVYAASVLSEDAVC